MVSMSEPTDNGKEPRDRRERAFMRIATAVSRAGVAVAVTAWLAWSITAFLGDRLPLLGLHSTGGVGIGLVWFVLLGPLFGLVIFIAFRLLATLILGIALIAVRRHPHH
jgi:hypothetical protein